MAAMVFSFVEFFIFQTYFDMKYLMPFPLNYILMIIGMLMMIVGHFFRITAEFTAGHNFNHRIQFYKDEKHELVTSGVYSISRHPSYLGWFLWAVGTQVFMLNCFCMVLYFGASWYFFSNRIT